jgi:LAO/AO transport system kinase
MAHTTVVVSIPGMGDDIQAMKAGLLEIGDIFVANKADMPGVEELVGQLTAMIEMGHRKENEWIAPVVETRAVDGGGISELVEAILRHRKHLVQSGKFKAAIKKTELDFFNQVLKEMAADRILETIRQSPECLDVLEQLKRRQLDPFSTVEQLLKIIQFQA